jgi:hypothetical protein
LPILKRQDYALFAARIWFKSLAETISIRPGRFRLIS